MPDIGPVHAASGGAGQSRARNDKPDTQNPNKTRPPASRHRVLSRCLAAHPQRAGGKQGKGQGCCRFWGKPWDCPSRIPKATYFTGLGVFTPEPK